MELPFTQSTCIPLEMLECDKLTIPQSFICPLNKNLIQDPVLDKCGHTFCRDCILNYIKTTPYCPIKTEKPLIIYTYELVPNLFAAEQIKEFLKKLKVSSNFGCVRCFYQDKGCAWKGLPSELFLHFETNCNFIKVQCTFKGCGKWLQRSQYLDHQSKCEHRTIICDQCKGEFPYCFFQQHFENCPSRNIECGYCNKIMKFCENEKHCETCEEMIIFCEKCNQQVKRKNYAKHLIKDCLSLLIDCQICDKKLKIDEIKEHDSQNMLMHQKQLLQKYNNLQSQQESQSQQLNSLTERVMLLEQENQQLQTNVSKLNSENLQFKTLHSKLTDKLLLQEVAVCGVTAQHLAQIKGHIQSFPLFSGKLIIFDLIYQASVHGMNYQSYQERITKQAPVLVLVINKLSDIFGGFTCKPLDTFAENNYDNNAFIFSLTQNLFFNNCMPHVPAIKTDSKREGIVFGQGGEQAPFGVVFQDPKDTNCFAGKKVESFGYDNYMLFNLQRLRTNASWAKNKQTVYFGVQEIFIFKLYYF